jgi:hypothetical protein
MHVRLLPYAILLAASGLYWALVYRASGTNEPWDSAAYWTLWYPASLVLSAMAGSLLKSRGWLAGTMLTFAQIPILWLNTGTDLVWAIALPFLCVLAIPAAAISSLAGRLANRVRPL